MSHLVLARDVVSYLNRSKAQELTGLHDLTPLGSSGSPGDSSYWASMQMKRQSDGVNSLKPPRRTRIPNQLSSRWFPAGFYFGR